MIENLNVDLQTIKDNSTKIFIGVIALLLVIILILSFRGGGDEYAADLGLNVNWKTGDVLFSGNGEIWEFADKGTLLKKGYVLRTSDDSKVILKTPQGSYIRLDENTEIKIVKSGKKESLITQNSGRTYHRVKFNSGNVYQVSVLGHTVKAVGTVFDISANKNAKRINVKVLEGKVKVAMDSKKSVDSQEVTKGKEITIDPAMDNVFAFADVTKGYIKSEWFKWNQEEDKKYGYEVSIADDILKGTTPKIPGADTSTTTTTKTPVARAGSCWPSMSAKKSGTYMGILLNWSTCSSNDFQFYKVIRSHSNPNLTYDSGTVMSSSSNKNYNSFVDKTVVHGRAYYYRICVIEKLGKVSCGNVASATY